MFGNLVNGYPTTNFHEINLDYILKLVRENNGLHLDASGNQLLLKTLDGTTVSTITVPYATNAGHADTATSANSATFATTATNATNAVNATNAGHALTADNATTAGTALVAQSATTAGTATEAVHATSADTATNATNAVNATNADYAETTGHVEHADKAIELVSISGDTVKFRTYDGTETVLTIPYAVKALKDSLGNEIKSTYVANVVDDNGTLKFKDAEGNDVVSLVPSVETASNDSYGNLIADMIKTIAVSSNSNYVTVTHGTGTVDTITINYSERAYKDTNDNVIKNTYIKSLEMVEDDDTGHYNLVAYNGDNPSAEIFRLELIAYRAQIADEATHASNADYATNAGTAQTAITSTGSVSSISSPTGNKQYIQITNGDGTTTKFNIPLWKIQFEFIEDVSQTNIFDNAFTVGHDEEYGISSTDLAKYGYTDVFDLLEEGTYIELLSNGNEVMFNAPIMSNKTSDGGYMIIVLNPYTVALEVFNIKKGTDDQHIKLTRLL